VKNLISTLALTLVSTQAHAVYAPNWERPVLEADMKLIQTHLGFEKVSDVKLTLTRRDIGILVPNSKYTGIQITYLNADNMGQSRRASYTLKITQAEKDGCGSTTYYAQLNRDHSANPKEIGARYNISLTDHSERICKDLRLFRWEAQVRQGYGWCGTMDSTMELGGNPESVITIQTLESSKTHSIRSLNVPLTDPIYQ